MSEYILDLENILKTYLELRERHQVIKGEDPTRTRYDWSGTRMTSVGVTAYNDIVQQPSSRSWLALNNSYKNTTQHKQEFRVIAERSVRNTMVVELRTSVRAGGDLRLSLSAPRGPSAEALASPVVHVPLEGSQEVEESVKWTVDTPITVSPRSAANVSVRVEEQRYKGSFQQATRIEGRVAVSFYDSNGDFLHRKQIPVGEMFRVYQEFSGFPLPTMQRGRPDNINIGSNWVDFEIKGKCLFQFTVKQNVNLVETPLP